MSARLKQWRFGFVSAILLVLVTSLPQIRMCYARGADWNGAFASFDTDEFAYAAYVNALISGRPRLNDPFTGQDGGPYETLFSIQALPAYTIAIPAHIIGISASTAFIVLIPLLSFVSALLLFRLLFAITEDELLAGLGSFAILCFGWIAGSLPWVFFTPHVAFPFLRRYLPGLPFPVFLGLTLFTWRALLKKSMLWASLAGLSLAILVYSYFFLWTAAAAWLVSLMVLWLLGRSHEWRTVLKVFGTIFAIALIASIPYAHLVQLRRPVTDQVQLMIEATRWPDLRRGPEVYGVLIALALFRKRWQEPKSLFALAFALAPFLIFHQQVITGRSIQPFHYEQLIANYVVLIGAFLALGICCKIRPVVITYIAVVAVLLGLGYGFIASSGRLPINLAVDEGRGAALKLSGNGLVFAANRNVSQSIPAAAPNPVLWARHLLTFSHLDFPDQKRRFYQQLYYSNASEEYLRAALSQEGDPTRFEVFGVDRANPLLTSEPVTITQAETQQAVAEYQHFSSGFSRADAATPLLSYAIVDPAANLSNLDRWYERDSGERVGAYVLYRLKLRDQWP